MFTTSRLLLRPYKPTDWEFVHVYAAVPEFSQYELWGPNSVEDTKEFIARCIAETSSEPVAGYQLAMELQETNVLIGGCTLKKQHSEANEAYLGYAVNPGYQNQGYPTEAAIALIRFGFDQLNLSCICATCDTRNVASWRVMEKAGLHRTALIRGDRIRKGARSDSYRYEIRRKGEV